MKFKGNRVHIKLLIVILIFPVAIPSQSAQHGVFSDNFDSSKLNSTWKKFTDPGVDIVQTQGVLEGTVPVLNFFNHGYIYKEISSSIQRIDVDY